MTRGGRIARLATITTITAVAGIAMSTGPAAAAVAYPLSTHPLSTQPLATQPPPVEPPPAEPQTAEPQTAGPQPPDNESTAPGGGSGRSGEPQGQTPRQDAGPTPGEDPAAGASRTARERAEAAEQAAERARAAAEAAERAREQARERAEQAATAENARLSWDSRGRPHRMATVRSDRVELVVDGRLTRMSARSGGPLTLATLARYLPDDWLSIQGGEALLNATVVLSRGTTLQIDDLYALRLTGGPTLSDASSIYTGSGRLIVRGAIVSSVDLHTRQPMPPNAAGRPFIEVNSRGYFEAVDATLTDLGTPAAAGNDGNAGVRFNADSTGSLVRTALQRGTTGLVLSRARDVRLEAVTVSDSAADGLVLHGDRGTALTGVRAEGNRGNGVLVGGESTDRALTGLSTSGNGLFGLAVVGQRGTRISGVTTSSDRAGGLRLSRSADVVVTDFTATDQPMGVFTHVHSTGIVIDRMRATGGRRAVVIEKSTEGIEVKAATIEGVRVAGVAAGGKVVRLTDLQVVDSKAGVRVERGAADVQITGLRVSGGQDGIVAAAGTSGVVVSDLTAEHVGADAVRTASTGTRVVGGRISGGSTGIDVAAATTITGTTIVAAQEGIRSRSPEPVRAETIAVDTTNLGVNVAAGSPFVLADSTVHALEAVRGPIVYQGANDVSLPPLNLLSAIGMPLVVLAVLLELGHAIRQHKTGGSTRRKPPPLVNAAGSTRPIKVQAAPARVPGPREPVPVDAWVHETSGSSPQQLGGGRELQEAGPRLGQQLAGGRVE